MIVSIVVAISTNGVIGNDNQLVWRLPNDLKYFKAVTLGSPIIMGRKTYESIGKPLPGRTNIVISRNEHLVIDGCHCVSSIEDAIEVARISQPSECFLIGGADIYSQALPMVDKIYLTEVHSQITGNITFNFDKSKWQEMKREDFPADEKHAYPYSFVELLRK